MVSIYAYYTVPFSLLAAVAFRLGAPFAFFNFLSSSLVRFLFPFYVLTNMNNEGRF